MAMMKSGEGDAAEDTSDYFRVVAVPNKRGSSAKQHVVGKYLRKADATRAMGLEKKGGRSKGFKIIIETVSDSITKFPLGAKISKKFSKQFYTGTIVSYKTRTMLYRVAYDDGDNEDMSVSEIKTCYGNAARKGKKSKQKSSSVVYPKGTKIFKEFDGITYSGTVVSFNRQKKLYKIEYEDGDKEDLDEFEMKLYISIESAAAMKLAAANSKETQNGKGSPPPKARRGKRTKSEITDEPATAVEPPAVPNSNETEESAPNAKRAKRKESGTKDYPNVMNAKERIAIPTSNETQQSQPLPADAPPTLHPTEANTAPESNEQQQTPPLPTNEPPTLDPAEKIPLPKWEKKGRLPSKAKQEKRKQPYPEGTKISKLFDGVPYGGVVASYDSGFGFYQILYDDGDTEEMDDTDVKKHLVAANPKKKPAKLTTPEKKPAKAKKARRSTRGRAVQEAKQAGRRRSSRSKPAISGHDQTNAETSAPLKDPEPPVTNMNVVDGPENESKKEIYPPTANMDAELEKPPDGPENEPEKNVDPLVTNMDVDLENDPKEDNKQSEKDPDPVVTGMDVELEIPANGDEGYPVEDANGYHDNLKPEMMEHMNGDVDEHDEDTKPPADDSISEYRKEMSSQEEKSGEEPDRSIDNTSTIEFKQEKTEAEASVPVAVKREEGDRRRNRERKFGEVVKSYQEISDSIDSMHFRRNPCRVRGGQRNKAQEYGNTGRGNKIDSYYFLIQRLSDRNYAMRGLCIDGDGAQYTSFSKENFTYPAIAFLPETDLRDHSNDPDIVDACHLDMIHPRTGACFLEEANMLDAVTKNTECIFLNGYQDGGASGSDSKKANPNVLVEMIHKCKNSLKCFGLTECVMSNEILQALATCRNLRGITLTGTRSGSSNDCTPADDDGMETLLKSCSDLRWLYLSENCDYFREASWETLCRPGTCPNLEVLWISCYKNTEDRHHVTYGDHEMIRRSLEQRASTLKICMINCDQSLKSRYILGGPDRLGGDLYDVEEISSDESSIGRCAQHED